MISLTNYDFQWARSELVIIYPDVWKHHGVPMGFPQIARVRDSPKLPPCTWAVASPTPVDGCFIGKVPFEVPSGELT